MTYSMDQAVAADSPPSVHRLQPGQTIAAVARLYGLPLAEVLAANPGLDVHHLMVGTPIILPQAVVISPAPQNLNAEQDSLVSQPLIPPQPVSNHNTQVNPTGNWQPVILNDGRKGWAPSTTLLIPSITPLPPQQVIEIAQRFLGTPYSWGGMSPNGVDCSGFIQEVFRLSGHTLPRLADQQFQQTCPIDEAQPGDLVFFSTYLPGPSHVGIFIGNGLFLHASSSQGVTQTSLDDPYFKERYLGVHRLNIWTASSQANNP